MAETYSDYREIFEKMGDRIDAAVVSTPDHTHAPASMLALNLGKHVYCQKPLTHDVYEARQVRLIAEKKGVATQMGIQIHSSNEYRTATQLIQDGTIGKVSEVHAWSNKNWGYDGPAYEGEDPIPAGLNWDMWIGTAQMRAFKSGVYHPANWRKLIDFGTGTLGDMGVHIFDTPFRALELTFPVNVKTSCRKPTGVGHPEKNLVRYEFPGTKHTTEKLIWKWYDGGYAPPQELKLGDRKLPGQGSLFIGEKGKMLLPHIGNPQFFDNDNQMQRVRLPQLPAIDHYHQWADAALGEGVASANFSYAGKLTESLLLGCVANRFPDEELQWDAANLKFTNKPEANQIIRRTYRKGFEVENLS
jgi:predicted dehydrogenase